MKKIIIIGSSGSIGTQALEIIRANPDKFRVAGLAVNSNTSLLEEQIEQFKPLSVSVEKGNYRIGKCRVFGNSAELIRSTEGDIILLAAVGVGGLSAAYEAAGKGVRIALANKETLVAAGDIIMKKARECSSEIIPVDSEHSAIFQSLEGNRQNKLKRILLTASGGAFRNYSKEQLTKALATEALKHPVWRMGAKVTIDSATLMNKGLEIIEAMHLFGVDADKIETVIHPESIIHSMVEFVDGSIIAQMGIPDMRLPIQYAFTYPDRIKSHIESADFYELKSLNFGRPDRDKFPCLDIAYRCAKEKGSAPLIMNSANESAVQLYLENRIAFYDIPALINRALDRFSGVKADSIEEIICIDKKVKEYILSLRNNEV